MTFNELIEDYNWREAWIYAAPSADVTKVVCVDEGENDGPEWLAVFELSNGKFGFLTAGCDYTGWECQASGEWQEANSLDELITMHMTPDERERLGLELP